MMYLWDCDECTRLEDVEDGAMGSGAGADFWAGAACTCAVSLGTAPGAGALRLNANFGLGALDARRDSIERSKAFSCYLNKIA